MRICHRLPLEHIVIVLDVPRSHVQHLRDARFPILGVDDTDVSAECVRGREGTEGDDPVDDVAGCRLAPDETFPCCFDCNHYLPTIRLVLRMTFPDSIASLHRLVIR